MDLNFSEKPRFRGPRARVLLAQKLAVVPLALLVSASASPVQPERAALSPPGQGPGGSSVEREAYVMGTLLRTTVRAPSRPHAIAASESALEEIRRQEQVLSSWLSESELGRLNSAPAGVPVPVSAELFAVLSEIWPWVEESGGAFNPAVGPLIDAWDLRGRGRRPTAAQLSEALRLSDPGAFRLTAEGTVTRLWQGSWLTAGGFGKGSALRAAEAVLREAGVESALFDFGGQGLAVGAGSGSGGWLIGVSHPSRRQAPIAVLQVRDVSVATSAASERYVEVAGRRYGHVIDPRTGWPVSAWGSVTVVARDPLIADILATTLFVLGPDRALDWLGEREGVGVLLLEELDRGRVAASWNAAMDAWLIRLNEDVLALGIREQGALPDR